MMALLWASFGMSLGAAVLHAALGLRRPINRTYLLFAALMGLVAVFLVQQWDFYNASTSEAAVEATRRRLLVNQLILGILLVFIPAYTKIAIPRGVKIVFWAGLAISIVANLAAPYGLWYSGPPELVTREFRGQPYSNVIAPPLELPQIAFALFVTSLLMLAIWCAVTVFRRGERQRGLALGIALALVLVHELVDVVQDHVGGAWPYIAEYGVVTWGLIMSVQLAHDFRVQAHELGRAIDRLDEQSSHLQAMLDALGTLEKNMHAPIDTLETGMAALAGGVGTCDMELQRLQRAVVRLREFSRSMPVIGGRDGVT